MTMHVRSVLICGSAGLEGSAKVSVVLNMQAVTIAPSSEISPQERAELVGQLKVGLFCALLYELA